MPEIRTNGSYEPYPGELFNPAVYGAFGVGAAMQNPWAGALGAQPSIGLQPPSHQTAWQTLQAIQIAQQIAARQVTQAIQQAQALQVLQQVVQILLSQPPGLGQPGVIGPQTGFGVPGQLFGQPQIGQPYGPGVGQQQAISQALQHLAQQQQQTFAAQPMSPYRYGLN